MKKLKIFPKMFIQIFSILGILIILVHSLFFFIFPKTYLETRKVKIHIMADEISKNMNGKELKYLDQTLELYSKSSDIKVFIKKKGTIYQFTPLTTYCIYENIKKVDFRFGSRLFNFNSCSLLKSCAFYIIVGNFQGQFFHLKTTV